MIDLYTYPTTEERISDFEKKALLTQYSEIRAQLRSVQTRFRRITIIGIGLVGAVVGYAVDSGSNLLLAAVPVLVAYLYTVGVHLWLNIIYLSAQSWRIEDKLDIECFDWEKKFSGALDSERPVPLWRFLNWNDVPILVIFSTGFLFYSGFALAAWYITPANFYFNGVRVNLSYTLLVVYALIAVNLLLATKSWFKIKNHLQEDHLEIDSEDTNNN